METELLELQIVSVRSELYVNLWLQSWNSNAHGKNLVRWTVQSRPPIVQSFR